MKHRWVIQTARKRYHWSATINGIFPPHKFLDKCLKSVFMKTVLLISESDDDDIINNTSKL